VSNYECRQGHNIPIGIEICPICGGRVYYEDGMSSREIEARDRYYEEERDEMSDER
jgi:hypothetical protein